MACPNATKHTTQSQIGLWDKRGRPKTGHALFFKCREMGGEALELYINQLVSASLGSPIVGLLINQTASLYGQNFTATANITFGDLPSNMV